jgi:TonB family protein
MLPEPQMMMTDTVDLMNPPFPERRALPRSVQRRRAGAGALLATGLGLLVFGALFRGPWWGPRVIPPPPGLQISTFPAGAAVLLEGVEVGKSPLFLTNLSPGLHVVKVVHEGFTPAELAVETSKEAPPVPLRFTLQPLTATLKVDSSPGAEVEIDGRPVGSTPLPGQQLPAGLHRVVVRRAGFRPWLRTIDTRPGETVRLEARLSALRGRGGIEDALRKNWVSVGDFVELGPGVTPPRKVAGQPAPYPEAARRMRLKGSVTVELTVTETGDVLEPRVVESAGEVLDEALVTALKNWRYEPADVNGVKVRVRFKERQTFGLH